MSNERDADLPVPRHEWETQERALRAERLHLSSGGENPDVAAYRMVARALRLAPQATLPMDFADQVARMLAPDRHEPRRGRIESMLALALGAVLTGGVVWQAAIHGRTWWQALHELVPTGAMSGPWLPLLAACLIATALCSRWGASSRPHSP